MSITDIAAIGVVGLTAILLAIFSVVQRRAPFSFRNIVSFTRLRRAVGLLVEDGTRLHFSVGHGAINSPQSASGFVALSALRQLGEQTSVSDQPPVVTAGDGALAALGQDCLSAAYDAAGIMERYDANDARAAGLTPFSYAAAVTPMMRDENISANVFIGSFGMEVGLMTDAAERENTFTVAGSDNLSGQAVLFASTPDVLVGEEVYAAGAYIKAGPMHTASLFLQDLLRWLLIVVILTGAVLKFLGVL